MSGVRCPVSGVGVLREGPLHPAIKAMLAAPSDRFEVPIRGFVIDLVRADGELVEVQTGGFSALGRKLDALLDAHRIRIVYPVAAERRIVRVDGDGEVTSVRRSPKPAGVVEVFDKLVVFPSLLTHPNLTIEVLLLREDHVRGGRPERVGRRTRDPGERRLIEVLNRVDVRGPGDVVRMLPAVPSDPFSTRELAALLGCTCWSPSGRLTVCERSESSRPLANGDARRCTNNASKLWPAPERLTPAIVSARNRTPATAQADPRHDIA